MNKIKKAFTSVFAALIIPVAVYLIFLILRPNVFSRMSVVYLLFLQSIESIILAWGMSFGMISGNMDLSVGAEVTLGSIAAAIAAKSFGVPGIVVAAMLTTCAVGAFKALILRVIKTSSLVISIAYCLILGALGAVVTTGTSLVITSEQTVLARLPWNIIITVAMGGAMYFLHRYSRFAAHCRAIGSNPKLAAQAGINQYSTYSLCFIIASVYAGASAIISLSRGAGTAAATGLQSMSPIFSAMIGVFIAMSIGKWVNIVPGIISGIMTMNIIGYGLLALGVESDIKNTITGGFLIALMFIMSLRDRRAQLKMQRDLFNMQKAARTEISETI